MARSSGTDVGGGDVRVVGEGRNFVVIPTVTANLYHINDNVGGKLKLANIARQDGGTLYLQDLLVIDKSNTKPDLQLLFFSSNPTVATITDHAAFVFGTDILKLCRRVVVAAADWVTINSIATADLSLWAKLVEVPAGVDLYLAIVLIGALPTFASTADLILQFGLLQD
jgi:hypothetical protein